MLAETSDLPSWNGARYPKFGVLGRLAIAGCLAVAIVSTSVGPAVSEESGLREIFRQLDEDGDGEVSRVEFQTRKVLLLDTRDVDKNNYITPDEALVTEAAFAEADADGDGRLSGLEWIGARFTDFDALDGNTNGSLTFDEIEAFAKPIIKKE